MIAVEWKNWNLEGKIQFESIDVKWINAIFFHFSIIDWKKPADFF